MLIEIPGARRERQRAQIDDAQRGSRVLREPNAFFRDHIEVFEKHRRRDGGAARQDPMAGVRPVYLG